MFASRAKSHSVTSRRRPGPFTSEGGSPPRRRVEEPHGGFVLIRTDPARLAHLHRRDERGARGASGDHLAHAERQSAQADPGGAQLSRRRHSGGGNAGHSSDPDPGLDAIVDFGAPLALIWYWWTFFR